MKAIGVIPARWASTRLPGKSLVLLGGKSMIQRVVERARQASLLETVVVATDDQRIVDAVHAFGAEAVMTCADHPSGTDRIAEVMVAREADLVVNIQGDEPLLNPLLIDRLVAAMQENADWDMGTAASPVTSEEDLKNPAVVKVVWDQSHRALYFSRSVIPMVRDGNPLASNHLHWRHIGIYAYRPAFLRRLVETPPCPLEEAEKLEQLRALYLGARMGVLETDEVSVGVDTPADVEQVEQWLKEHCEKG